MYCSNVILNENKLIIGPKYDLSSKIWPKLTVTDGHFVHLAAILNILLAIFNNIE